MLRILPWLTLLLACNQAEQSGEREQTKVQDSPNTKTVQHTNNNSSSVLIDTSDKSALTPLSEEDKDYITPQEDARYFHDARKQFEKLSSDYLEQLYGEKPADARALHVLMRKQLIAQRRKSGFKVSRPFIPDEWARPEQQQTNVPLADLVYVYGDIDNLGYGWPANYDPFSGESTKPHGFPFVSEPDDPPGTDRIMVNSGYQYPSKAGGYKREKSDGYTSSTRRPDNLPETLRLQPPVASVDIKQVVLQIFVDDFQAPSFSSQFRFYLNDREIPSISTLLNELKQGGPVGKLITLAILPEYFSEIKKGRLNIFIDSPTSVKGDGFAIDFVRLLINPKSLPLSSVSGRVTDAKTRKPIADALIRISGAGETRTDGKGEYRIDRVPCGMVLVQASCAGYKSKSGSDDLTQRQPAVVNLKLEPETDAGMQEQLDEKGKVELYGIYFDTDKASIKSSSLPTLNKLAELIRKNPNRKLEIGGHTDAEGDDTYNLRLSGQRAEAVLTWLKEQNLKVDHLQTRGYGETEPVADNQTEAGRALNRRVEIKLLTP